MNWLDWLTMLGTLLFIAIYGTWKTRKNKNIKSYLQGDKDMKWVTIGLSVMATQASAITFISTPGQAFESGMGFVQNYFGLPLALIIVSAVFIPIYYKLNVFTAYEFLESRFDLKTRLLAAFLFLFQRGLAAGITIYAPAIILSTTLGWNLSVTIVLVGLVVVIYTVSGGTKAVSLTQKWQMGVIMLGMFIAFFIIINSLPDYIGFLDAVDIAGRMGKLDAVNFSFDPTERYTFWSGITGGLFLALSYFGTDQSQVQRYLGGKSVTESRMGLMFNAVLKIPMQFFILFVGVMVFVFYQFESHEVLFDKTNLENLRQSKYSEEISFHEDEYAKNHQIKQEEIRELIKARNDGNAELLSEKQESIKELDLNSKEIRANVKQILIEEYPEETAKDSDFVFLTFIMNYLPHGIIGLLLAVIISAAMSSTAGELNALGSTTVVDFYKRLMKSEASDTHYVIASRLLTALWGILAIMFALFARLLENLIEAVNILGSLFYGTILGIFLVAFFFKRIKGSGVFSSALLAQLFVFILYIFFEDVVAYLWYNVIGCLLVIFISHFFLFLTYRSRAK
ncbi:sodium:solute symporter [Hyphobacterium sp. CCMP332]|nr:sodium:solute symporter [Hyphobacterium sp. CCMP332]